MDFSGWQAVIPIAIACVGLWTIAMWVYRGLVWAGVRVRNRTRASRVDMLAARMDGLEHRMDGLENGVTRVIELLEAQKALPS